MKDFSLASLTLIAAIVFACSPRPVRQPAGDTSRTSLDWPGVYTGIVPCADCEGIETMIMLNKDNSFIAETQYKGRSAQWTQNKGRFIWNDAGNKITLQPEGSANVALKYAVGENKLTQLDLGGNVIAGNLADKYVLNKDNSGITEKYWKLIELNGLPVTSANRGPKEAYFVLKAAGGRVMGNSSCNGFAGGYTLEEGDRIRFSKLAGTMMACPNMETETGFYRAFEMADNFSRQNDTLSLNKAQMAPLAKFIAIPAPLK